MKKYVLGFAFNEGRGKVALIWKNRPDYQAGKLNGIGGKVEHGEYELTAMRREFFEETGVKINTWTRYAKIIGPDWRVTVFKAFTDDMYGVKSMTDEIVQIQRLSELAITPHMDNLALLIPAALQDVYNLTIQYK